MRNRSYLEMELKTMQNYSKKGSYVVNDDRDSLREYSLLPEEYDIFSELNSSFFTQGKTKQQEIIHMCLIYMKECLLDFYHRRGIICILPKLKYTQDDEGTITFSMALSNYRAFLSFEGEKGKYDAYFGVVSRTDEDSISSETKKLTDKNYQSAIRFFLQILITNA